MSDGDWIALGGFGLTGLTLFCTLIGVIWHWSTAIEVKLAQVVERLGAMERVLGMTRQSAQVEQSHRRIFRRGADGMSTD